MSNSRPLCVDLDHTLLNTDLLHEKIARFLFTRPWGIFLIIFWSFKGKFFLKQKLAKVVNVSIADLPVNQEVQKFCENEYKKGREILIVTDSHQESLREVSKVFSFVSDVFGSDEYNLKGRRKAKFLVEKFGEKGFDYIGDSRSDIAVWKQAKRAYIVRERDSKLGDNLDNVEKFFLKSQKNIIQTILTAMRPGQYGKNLLVFLPMILGHEIGLGKIFSALICFFIFGLSASSVYIFNDLTDLEDDRQHPTKKFRPFASGRLSPLSGLALIPFFLTVAFVLCALLNPTLILLIGIYLLVNLAYSLYFKKIPIVDVFILSSFYVLRLVTGAVGTAELISDWLFIFSFTFFLGLELLKRYIELSFMYRINGEAHIPGRGYVIGDLNFISLSGVSSSFLSILIFVIYIFNEHNKKFYSSQVTLLCSAMLILFWIMIMWFKANRGTIKDDPLRYAMRDPLSLLIGLSVVSLILLSQYSWTLP